jgi:hypothetical protein
MVPTQPIRHTYNNEYTRLAATIKQSDLAPRRTKPLPVQNLPFRHAKYGV